MLRRKVLAVVLITLASILVAADDQQEVAGENTEHHHDDHDHLDLGFLDFFSDENTEDDSHLEQHLREDMGIEKSLANMTESEKDWYYFKLHDTNGDFMLDGLELFKAWQHHYLEHMGQDGLSHTDNSTEEMKKYIEQQNESFVTMVDAILESQDTDNNGYIDYVEYMFAKIYAKEEEERAKLAEEKKKKQQ